VIGERGGDRVVRLLENAPTSVQAQRVVAVAPITRPELPQSGIHFRRGDRAAFYIDQSMLAMTVVADHAFFGVHGDPIAVAIRRGRGDDRLHGHCVEPRDAAHRLFDLLRFQRELMVVADVLICASAAPAEVWALGFDAMLGRDDHLPQFAFAESLFVAQDRGSYPLAVDCKRDEDSFAVVPADAASAERDIVDLEVHRAHGEL
jgi:hypothetical protein